MVNKNERAGRVLNLLFEGYVIKMGNYRYAMGANEDGTPVVCYVLEQSVNGKPPEEVLVEADITVNYLIKVASEIPEMDFIQMTSGSALSKARGVR